MVSHAPWSVVITWPGGAARPRPRPPAPAAPAEHAAPLPASGLPRRPPAPAQPAAGARTRFDTCSFTDVLRWARDGFVQRWNRAGLVQRWVRDELATFPTIHTTEF